MASEKEGLRRLAMGLPLFVFVASPTSALVAQAEADVPAMIALKATPEQTLARTIGLELSKSPPEASSEELEAFIVFVLSQKDYEPGLVEAALDIAAAKPNISDVWKTAIENVKAAYARKRIKRGTAGIDDSGRGFGGSFSSPGANIGGGSSNYS